MCSQKIEMYRWHIFTIFYTHGSEAECTHSECKQHMKIVSTSAEGVSIRILLFLHLISNGTDSTESLSFSFQAGIIEGTVVMTLVGAIRYTTQAKIFASSSDFPSL